MFILAIDTSFDDTAVAIVKDREILSNVLSTDLSVHLEYGGVVPRLARQSHIDHLDDVIALAFKRAHLGWERIDAIAVTVGPGLAICLEIGIAKAQELAKAHAKPLIPVNHLEGHLLSFLAKPRKRRGIPSAHSVTLARSFPALGVIISGGNTQFVYTEKPGVYAIVGETQDDAMGEAFDKVGRMLGLGYPAGPFLEKIARIGKPGVIKFPVPMRQVKSADTSFSGLKTAASRIISLYSAPYDRQVVANVALGFQTSAITHLIEKMEYALEKKKIRSIVVGGGVAKNVAVRKAIYQFGRARGLSVYFPYTSKLFTDNAGMIGVTASLNPRKDASFDRKPVWRIDSTKD